MITPQKITNLLNRQALTVSELAAALGISRNSVHVQISKLEAAGIVEKFRRTEQTGAGKPAHCYRLVACNEDAFSSAYKPILSTLVQTISTDLDEAGRKALLEKTGRLLAQTSGLIPSTDLDRDINQALNAVNALGAMAEFTRNEEQPYISCHTCPVATLVHTDPLVCNLVSAFFSEATGKDVAVKCRHEETVVCGFAVDETA